jgi:hypothetical protein
MIRLSLVYDSTNDTVSIHEDSWTKGVEIVVWREPVSDMNRFLQLVGVFASCVVRNPKVDMNNLQ